MKLFKQPSLATRILIPPAIVILFLFGVAIVSCLGSLAQETALKHVVTAVSEKGGLSSRLKATISATGANLQSVIALADSGIEDELIEKVRQEVRSKIEKATHLIETFKTDYAHSTEEAELIDQLSKSLEKYTGAAESIMEMAALDRMLAIPMMGEVGSAQRELDDIAENLVSLENRLAGETSSRSVQMGRKGRYLFICLVMAAIVISVLVTFIIGRRMTQELSRIIQDLRKGSELVTRVSDIISQSSRNYAAGASEQDTAVHEIALELKQISEMLESTTSNAGNAEELVQTGDRILADANLSMQKLITSMEEISSASEKTSAIIKTIEDIAFQTNLLALNAAVEAARAGESGAGFAVVASEVRSLAQHSADAARNTSAMIQQTVESIRNGSAIVSRTHDSFKGISDNSKKLGALVNEMARASERQNQGIHSVNTSVTEISSVTKENSQNALSSSHASSDMARQAREMEDIVQMLMALVGEGAGSKGGRASGTG